MVIKKILEKVKPKEPGEEFIEISPAAFREEGKINIRVEKLESSLDVDKVQTLVREGNVVFVKIKDLKEKNFAELKKAVEKLKRTCMAMNGDIVSVDEEYLIITPSYAKIYR